MTLEHHQQHDHDRVQGDDASRDWDPLEARRQPLGRVEPWACTFRLPTFSSRFCSVEALEDPLLGLGRMPGPRSVTLTVTTAVGDRPTSTGFVRRVLHGVRDQVGQRPVDPDSRTAHRARDLRRLDPDHAIRPGGQHVLDDMTATARRRRRSSASPWPASTREDSRMLSTSASSRCAWVRMLCTAVRRWSSESRSPRLSKVCAQPLIGTSGVRSSCETTAMKSSLSSSSSRAWVMLRATMISDSPRRP